MFAGAASVVALLTLLMAQRLPRCPPMTTLPYFALLASVATLWRRYPVVRQAVLAQTLLSVAFSAFWSTLAVMLQAAPFHLGSAAAGAFGLAGAAGVLVAPLAGAIADRRDPEQLTRYGALLVMVAFLIMGMLPASLWIIGLGAITFDLGTHASLIAHQSIIYGVDTTARSRLNALLIGSMFIGMGCGAALASLLLQHAGWPAVCWFAASAAGSAWLVRLGPRRG